MIEKAEAGGTLQVWAQRSQNVTFVVLYWSKKTTSDSREKEKDSISRARSGMLTWEGQTYW